MKTDIFREQLISLSSKASFDDNFVLPDYQNLNVKNIAPLVETIYGIKSPASANIPKDYVDDFEGVSNVILVILDGFGFKRLLTHLNDHDGTFAEFAQKGVLKPLTTVFPSTTSSVLASIFTGLSPAEHNIIGYQMFSKKYGLVYNTLDMKPVYGYSRQVEIAEDYSRKIKPRMRTLEENGVRTLIATKASIAEDGLSRIIYQDQAIIPYRMLSDMLVQSNRVLKQQDPTLLIMYYSGVDNLEHKYGPQSEEVTFELNNLECNLKNFISKMPDQTRKRTIILITADHGVEETRKTYFLKDIHNVNTRLMVPPVGDSRATFLYANSGQRDALADAFRKNVDEFEIYPSMELIKTGAFGQTTNSDALAQSVGDFTALSTGKSILQYPYFEDDRGSQQLGAHGGMTQEEMIVPLLSVRLSKL